MGTNELTLFSLAGPLEEALKRLTDVGMDETTIADTIDGMAVEFREKAVAVVSAARNLEALALSIKSAEDEMYERRKALEKRAAAIRAYVKEQMERAGIQKLECPHFQIAIRHNPPAIVVDAPTMVPERFWVQQPPPPPTLDKNALKAALKAGEDVPGVHLSSSTRLDVK